MSSDSNNLDLSTGLSSASSASGMNNNPVSDFEADKRSLLQKTLAQASQSLKVPPSSTAAQDRIIEVERPVASALRSKRQVATQVVRNANTQNEPEMLQEEISEEEATLTGWGKISSGFAAFGKGLKKLATKLSQVDWLQVGKSCVSYVEHTAKMVVNTVIQTIKNPTQLLNNIAYAAKNIIPLAIQGVNKIVNGIVYAVQHPIETGKLLATFAKGMCDQLGVTDIIVGSYHGIRSLAYLSVGNVEEAGKHGKLATRALAGALVAIGEFSGVSDLGRACIALSKGDYAKAALFGAMGAFQLYTLCTTLGLGNILTSQGRQAAVKGMKIVARSTGQEIVDEVEKRISVEVLHRTTKEVAIDSGKSILKRWSDVVRDVYGISKNIVREKSELAISNLLRKHGLDEVVSDKTLKLLLEVSNNSFSHFRPVFSAAGIEAKEAQYLYKCMQKALSKSGKKLGYQKLLETTLTDEFTAMIKENLMDRGLREGFEQSWRKVVMKIAASKNLSPQYTQFMLSGGLQGFEEGVEAGVRKIVAEGVKKAFEDFNKMRREHDQARFRTQEEIRLRHEKYDLTKVLDENAAKKKVKAPKRWMKRADEFWKRGDEDDVIRDIDGNVKYEHKEKAKYSDV